jgi:hypothetical protein
MGRGGIAPTYLLTSVLDAGEVVSIMPWLRFTMEKDCQYRLYRRLDGSQSQSECRG